MPYIAKKDYFVEEDVGGHMVRRQVFAGTVVPDHLALADTSNVEEVEGNDMRAATFGEPVTGPDDEGKRSSAAPTGRNEAVRKAAGVKSTSKKD